MGTREDYWASKYANKALVGAIDELLQPGQSDGYLFEAYRFLFDQTFPDYLSIAYDVIPYLTQIPDANGDPKALRKGLDAGYMLMNLSLIVDMLWWYTGHGYDQQIYQDSLLSGKLDSLATFIQRRIHYSRPIGHEADSTDTDYENAGYPGGISDVYPGVTADTLVWPSFEFTNFRLTGLGALGYAGAVLPDSGEVTLDGTYYENYLDLLDYELDEIDGAINCTNGPAYINGPGYINHNLHSSGIYAEGITYMSQVMNEMILYFTARNRYDNKNYYDIFTEEMFAESISLISPDFGFVCFDDAYYKNINDIIIFPVGYYQWLQQTSAGGELSNSIKWYAENYKNEYGLDYLVPLFPREANLQSILSYSGVSITGGSMPAAISQGNYSNIDYTVLRSEISDTTEFKDQSAMWITHNQGVSYSSHEQGDQSSFVLWYKGQQLITDPGYYSISDPDFENHGWCVSSFAHNVIQVENITEGLNLDYSFEDNSPQLPVNTYEFIEKIEPIGRHDILADPAEVTRNPVTKCYQYESNDISALKVNLKYYNTHDNVQGNDKGHEIGSEKIDLFRYYYRVGEDMYLIFDDMQRLESDPGVIDMANQLHFEAYDDPLNNTDQELTQFPYGGFELTNNLTNINLYGAMGSLHAPETGFPEIKENLPFGQYKDNADNLSYAHRAMRLKTRTDEDEKFLTLLFPSESSTNPIDVQPTPGEDYAVKVNLDPETGYYAIGDENIIFNFDGNFYDVTGNFFGITGINPTYDNELIELSSIILNNGDYINCHDLLLSHNCEYYESAEIYEEFNANYDSNELATMTVMKFTGDELPSPIPNPVYKILRCCVDPENLCSKTYYYLSGEYTSNQRGTIDDNIQELAYDDKYFYVNYEFADLPNSPELVLYKGNYSNITFDEKLTIGNGDIGITGNITVAHGDSLIFLAGTKIEIAENIEFDIEGTVMAVGDSAKMIEFLPDGANDWYGFLLSPSGFGDFRYCKISGANYGIRSSGFLTCKYNEIFENNYGVFLSSPIQYKISYNYVFDNDVYGFFLSYTTETGMYECYIENNELENNLYGIYCFSSNAEINDNYIHHSKRYGIYATHSSNPVITYNMVSDSREDNTDYPEIYLVDNSYPVLDKKYNDIIIERTGTSESIHHADQYPLSFYECTKNYWGTVDRRMIEGSFYPADWGVIFEPFSLENNTEYGRDDEPETLFEEGFAAEQSGDMVLAKEKYQQSIAENPNYMEAIWSASRLINCVNENYWYEEIQYYYEVLIENSSNPHLVELSEYHVSLCDRKLKDFQSAIYNYEDLFDDEMLEIDSLLTMLDIVYTYLEAEEYGGRSSNLRFREESHRIRNLVHAQELEYDILHNLMVISDDGGIYSPIIYNIILHHNYPNPFYSSSTFSYSIPNKSNVSLTIYNIKGQKVKTLVNDEKEKGIWKEFWDGKDNNNKTVSSGVYLYKLNVNGKTKAVKKCLMLK